MQQQRTCASRVPPPRNPSISICTMVSGNIYCEMIGRIKRQSTHIHTFYVTRAKKHHYLSDRLGKSKSPKTRPSYRPTQLPCCAFLGSGLATAWKTGRRSCSSRQRTHKCSRESMARIQNTYSKIRHPSQICGDHEDIHIYCTNVGCYPG